MEKYQIFISYRRDGGDALAGRLADRFNALGYKVFYDVESMRSGTFNTQILEAITQCNDVLLVLPPNALDRCVNKDDWVRQEVAFALKHNKNIIPIIMRGFEFPATLPVDIDNVRNMEGVTASSEYFDAVIERIKSLLSSSNNLLSSKYSLETKEYYQIKTPLKNSYKRLNYSTISIEALNACIAKKFRLSDDHVVWVGINGEKQLKVIFASCDNDKVMAWYNQNENRLLKLNNIIKLLKKYNPNKETVNDNHFYNNAVFYGIGLARTLPTTFDKQYIDVFVPTLCYCIDWPEKDFEILEDAFIQGGDTDFTKYLPQALEYWATLNGFPARKDKNFNNLKTKEADFFQFKNIYDSQYRKEYDYYALLLFDFMLECALLANDLYWDKKHLKLVNTQIRSYYKFLKSCKIFLPKEMQEKIYRYL